MQLAKNLREHSTFSSESAPPFTPELFRLPGYPGFLALLNATERSDYRAVAAVQCFIAAFLGIAAWPSMKRLGGTAGATIGAIVLSLDLGTVLHAPMVLTEILLQALMVAGLITLVRWADDRSPKALYFSAACWSVAGLVKPIALFIPILIFLVEIRHLRRAFVFGLIAFSLPLMWAARNSLEVRQPVYTVQGGYALLFYPASYAYGLAENIDMNEAAKRLQTKIKVENPGLIEGSLEESQAYETEAKRVMRQYPKSVFKYCVIGVVRILGATGINMLAELWKGEKIDDTHKIMMGNVSGRGTLRILKDMPGLIPIALGYTLFLAALYTLFLLGVWKLLQQKYWTLGLTCLLAVLMLLAVAAHQGSYRMRVPLIPFMAFAAAAFFKKSDGKPL